MLCHQKKQHIKQAFRRNGYSSIFLTTTFLNINALSLTLNGFPLAVVTPFRTTSRVLMYGYFST